MRRVCGFIVALLALGLGTLGCTQSDTASPGGPQASAADVVLTVPGMH